MKKYKYKFCSKCKEEKTENRNPYCIDCSREYMKEYKHNKNIQPIINLDGLKEFIRVFNLHNKYSIINTTDINNIVIFYGIIVKYVDEYVGYKEINQIKFMWNVINEYYEKEVKKINI